MTIDGDDPPWVTIESGCYLSSPAMQLGIRVEQDVLGTGEQEVTIHFGARHVQRFAPNPAFDSTGRVRWGVDDGDEPRKGIAVGTRLGLAVRFLPNEGIWSAMGEPLFAVTEAGTLTAQKPEECLMYPSVLYGGTFSELESAIAACSAEDLASPATVERKKRVALRWGADVYPAFAYAPECHDGVLPTAQ